MQQLCINYIYFTNPPHPPIYIHPILQYTYIHPNKQKGTIHSISIANDIRNEGTSY